ncbi:MAG TPA: response regulator [Patescibacteria group bacterium]|nr:response regulator [Patescibacteria group bacterium]
MLKEKVKNILLVEDDPFLSNIYKEKLSQAGYKVRNVGAAKGALELIKEEKPDLILLDIMLVGKLNGYVVLEKVKGDKKLQDIIVIMLSNLSAFKEKMKAKNLGADNYILKIENTPEEVLNIIIDTFKKKSK